MVGLWVNTVAVAVSALAPIAFELVQAANFHLGDGYESIAEDGWAAIPSWGAGTGTLGQW
jgi:hypothetical protein